MYIYFKKQSPEALTFQKVERKKKKREKRLTGIAVEAPTKNRQMRNQRDTEDGNLMYFMIPIFFFKERESRKKK